MRRLELDNLFFMERDGNALPPSLFAATEQCPWRNRLLIGRRCTMKMPMSSGEFRAMRAFSGRPPRSKRCLQVVGRLPWKPGRTAYFRLIWCISFSSGWRIRTGLWVLICRPGRIQAPAAIFRHTPSAIWGLPERPFGWTWTVQ